MNKRKINELQNSIDKCKIKIKAILPHLGEDKPVLNKVFNQLLIEKAILSDKMKRENLPLLTKLTSKLRFKHKKQFICDYFKTCPQKS